jgi:membrane associated rhomboid family serine protease
MKIDEDRGESMEIDRNRPKSMKADRSRRGPMKFDKGDRGRKCMGQLFVVVFGVVYFTFGTEAGYSLSAPWYRHFTYMFQHASLLHLCINSVAFYGVFRLLGRAYKGYAIAGMLAGIAFGVSFFANGDMPTVGSSGMIYAGLGLCIATALGGTRLRIKGRGAFGLFCGLVVAGLLGGLLHRGYNFALHLYALLGGLATGGVLEIIHRRKRIFSRQAQ